MTEKKTQGLTVKKENFSEWYPEVIQKSELADYSMVSGCIIYRPYSYSMWEKVKSVLNSEFKKLNVKNAYFPLLIPESLFNKEKEHVEGFNPEVAWVTKGGNSELDEPLAIRPTSETIIYDSYSKWIHSWRDLPLKLNQWCNIIRWEFRHPRPFLRGREFLWQEGHTVFSNKEEAEKECTDILDIYYKFVKEYMALEGTKSLKTDKEKFAGAVYSKSLEYMMPDGKMIQGPDTHFDGQKFAKAYDIKFLDKNSEKKYVYQNTWGFSTRMLGVMFAMHGDDKGLIIPPKIAPTQIVIVPIYKEENKKEVIKHAKEISKQLNKFRVHLDDRDEYTPGWKFNEWELKGVPLRIEIGPKDIKEKSVVVVRRDTGKKEKTKIKELKEKTPNLLENIQENLYKKSKKFLDEHTKEAKDYKEIKKFVKQGRVLVKWCGCVECENKVKDETGAKTTGMPLDNINAKGECAICKKPAKYNVYFAKSY